MQLNYHIIFQHLHLLSPRLRQFHRRKMPSLNSPVPLQLHLKALLEDLGPSAVVIEMIAMLFVDTVIGERGRDSSSNPDKGVQSFPESNYEKNRKTVKVWSMTIRGRIGGCFVPLLHCISATREQDPTLRFPLEGSCQISSTQISSSMKITWAGTGIMALLHIHIMRGTITTEMNKNTEGGGLNIHGTLAVFFIVD